MSSETRHFSILNVTRVHGNGRVDGYWIRDHHGTLDSAREEARKHEAANSHKITVAVIEPINSTTPNLNLWTYRKLAKNAGDTEAVAD